MHIFWDKNLRSVKCKRVEKGFFLHFIYCVFPRKTTAVFCLSTSTSRRPKILHYSIISPCLLFHTILSVPLRERGGTSPSVPFFFPLQCSDQWQVNNWLDFDWFSPITELTAAILWVCVGAVVGRDTGFLPMPSCKLPTKIMDQNLNAQFAPQMSLIGFIPKWKKHTTSNKICKTVYRLNTTDFSAVTNRCYCITL